MTERERERKEKLSAYAELVKIWNSEKNWDFPLSFFEAPEGLEVLDKIEDDADKEAMEAAIDDLVKKREAAIDLQTNYDEGMARFEAIQTLFAGVPESPEEKFDNSAALFDRSFAEISAVKSQFETAWHFYHVALKAVNEEYEKLTGKKNGDVQSLSAVSDAVLTESLTPDEEQSIFMTSFSQLTSDLFSEKLALEEQEEAAYEALAAGESLSDSELADSLESESLSQKEESSESSELAVADEAESDRKNIFSSGFLRKKANKKRRK